MKKSKTHKKRYNGRRCKTRRKRQKGGVIMPLDVLYSGDLMQEGPYWVRLCRSVPNEICATMLKTVIPRYLYGSSMPILSDKKKLEDTFKFYMFRKEINVIISLQACGDLNYIPQRICIAGDRDIEERTWEEIKRSNPDTADDPNIQFYNEYIRDLTAGTLVRWIQIMSHTINNRKQKTLVHCLAGFGRTGSVLLFNIMRYMMSSDKLDKDALMVPFLTYPDSKEMYRGLVFDIFNSNVMTDNNVDENRPYNDRIIEFDSRYAVRELFAFDSVFKSNLLIIRINLILLLIANNFLEEGSNIYLYSVHPVDYVPSLDRLFVPVLCEFNKKNLLKYIKDNSGSNYYGIIYN